MKKRVLITAAALACTASMLAGTVMAAHPLTNATFVWEMERTEEKTAEEVKFGLPMLENAVRQYLGLDEDEALTADLLEGITSITFSLSDFNACLNQTAYEGKTAVKIEFNHGALPGVAEYEGAGYAYEALPRMIRTEYFDLSAITDAWQHDKFASFYTVKDPADPLLTERGVAEMNALFPNTMAASLAIMDPEAKPRELKELFVIADAYGLVNTDTFIDGNLLRLKYTDAEQFPDLEVIEFKDSFGIAGNLPVEVLFQEAGLIPEEDIPVEFESLLLENALREYFGLDEGQPLTQGMIEQVKTIDFCVSAWQEGLVKIEGYENRTAVKCIINGGAILDENGTEYPSINPELPMYENVFNGMKSVFGYEALPVTVRTKYLETDSIADEWNRVKMNSFYTVKDSADPTLEPEAAEELLMMFPATALDSFVFIDPMAKPRELAVLLSDGFEFGIVNEETILDGTVIGLPWSDMEKLSGLIEVICGDDLSVEYAE